MYPSFVLKIKFSIGRFVFIWFLWQLQNLQNLWTVEKLQENLPSAWAAKFCAIIIDKELQNFWLTSLKENFISSVSSFSKSFNNGLNPLSAKGLFLYYVSKFFEIFYPLPPPCQHLPARRPPIRWHQILLNQRLNVQETSLTCILQLVLRKFPVNVFIFQRDGN